MMTRLQSSAGGVPATMRLTASRLRNGGVHLLVAIASLLALSAGAANAASYSYTTTTFAWHDPIASGDTRISTNPAVVAQVPAPPAPYWPNPANCSGYCDNLGDDALSAPINIGFTFNFAGTNYTQLQIQSNGRLQFNNNYSYYGTQNIGSYGVNPSPPPPWIWSGSNPRQYTITLPNASMNNTMQVYGTDVDTSPNGSGGGPSPTGCSPSVSIPTVGNNYVQGKCGVYYAQLPAGCTAGVNCSQFVVTWLNVPDWGDATSSYNFQAILNSNGTFIYQYNTSVNPEFGQANVGYQGASVADYVNYVYPGPTSPYSGGIASLAGTAVLWGTVPSTTVGKFNAFETVTAATKVTGFINTKVAATGFTLALVANNGGVQDNTFTGNVTVDLLGNTALGVPLDAANCPTSSSTVLAAFTATITAGRSNVAFAAVPNVWQDVRVRIRYPVGGPYTTTICSTDNFAIRPSALTVSAQDATWTTAGIVRTLANAATAGGIVHQAGAPFTVAVSVLPATATNYNGSPTVVSANCTVLAGMSGCNPGVLALPGGAAWVAGNPLVNNTASYSEAGVFDLTLEDHNFASVDAADGESAAVLTVPQSGGAATIGRFVPASFTVTAGTAPVFRTFNTTDALCNAAAVAPKRSFTYIGQPFGYATAPTVTVTAVNLAGTTTTNYRGSLWKLVASPPAATVTCPSSNVCNATVGSVIEGYTDSGGKAWDSSQFSIAPTTVTPGTGTGTITLNAADAVAYLRSVNAPVVPFNANISLNVSVQDTSEAVLNGTIVTTGGGATFNGGGAGVLFDGGGAALGTEFRYGRLQLANANGSELLPLSMRMTTQYFAVNAGFVDNTADNCTTIANANIGFANYQLNLTAGATTAAMPAGAFLGGVKNLTLSAPGANKYGAVDVVVDLGFPLNTCTALVPLPVPTVANLPYLRNLQYCSGGNYDRDPTAHATFGGYGVNRNFIYLRENY